MLAMATAALANSKSILGVAEMLVVNITIELTLKNTILVTLVA